MQFGTLEHAYQYVKTKRYGDDSCSENIVCCRTASDAKHIGSWLLYKTLNVKIGTV